MSFRDETRLERILRIAEHAQETTNHAAFGEIVDQVNDIIDDKSSLLNAQFGDMVDELVKPGKAIVISFNPTKANLMHMVLGISGEAGELVDAIKKCVIYGQTLDVLNVIEELGDLEFYMEGLRQELGVSREDILLANMAKLSERYKDFQYSDKAATERVDKT